MDSYLKVPILLNFVRMRISYLLDLLPLQYVTWVIRGRDHFHSTCYHVMPMYSTFFLIKLSYVLTVESFWLVLICEGDKKA